MVSGPQLLSPLVQQFFSRRCGFQEDTGSGPTGEPGQWLMLVFKI